MTDKEIVLAFIKAINDHDVNKILDLMPEDHVFIDGRGGKQIGKTIMKEGWQNYFRMFPDYSVKITDIVEENSVIGLFGNASATYKFIKETTNSNFWETPAAWKAIVENKKIKHWQVYCDYTQLMEIVKMNQPE